MRLKSCKVDVERPKHFLHGLIACLWPPDLHPWSKALLQRCLQGFEWKILAWHNVNTVQASNPIEQHLRRRNIHDRKMPSQCFGGPFRTEQTPHHELLYALGGVNLYSGAETETVTLSKALAQDNGLRLGQDGKGVLFVSFGPLKGVVTHHAVGNDINAATSSTAPPASCTTTSASIRGATAATPGTRLASGNTVSSSGAPRPVISRPALRQWRQQSAQTPLAC